MAASISPFRASSASLNVGVERTPNRASGRRIPSSVAVAPSSRSRTNRSSGGRSASAGAVLAEDVLRDVRDVVAVVAVLGDLRRRGRSELQVPRLDRRAEPVHLPAGVVEVVLALDRRRRSRRAGCASASPSAALRAWPTCSGPVGFAETNSTCTRRPVGVGGHAEPVALREDLARASSRSQPRIQEEVDEPGPGDLGALDQRDRQDGSTIASRDVARRALHPRRQDQGHVRRPVPVLLDPRLRQLRLGHVRGPSTPRSARAAETAPRSASRMRSGTTIGAV